MTAMTAAPIQPNSPCFNVLAPLPIGNLTPSTFNKSSPLGGTLLLSLIFLSGRMHRISTRTSNTQSVAKVWNPLERFGQKVMTSISGKRIASLYAMRLPRAKVCVLEALTPLHSVSGLKRELVLFAIPST